jgi:hypothetical protein
VVIGRVQITWRIGFEAGRPGSVSAVNAGPRRGIPPIEQSTPVA